MKRGPNYLIQVQLFCGSAARLDSFMPASRTNRQSAHPKRSRPGSKPKLKTLKKHKVIAGQNALDAWVFELIQVKVRLHKNPVIEIPVDAYGELIGVVAKRRDDSRRNRAGRDGGGIASCASRSPLQPGIAELQRPRTPTRGPRFSGRIGANYRVLYARNGVLRLAPPGPPQNFPHKPPPAPHPPGRGAL